MKPLNRILALAAIGLMAVGCAETAPAAEFGNLQLTANNTPPGQISLQADRITLAEGAALSVTAEVESRTSEPYSVSTELDLRTSDSTVFQVYPSGGVSFVLVGISEGESCLEVVVDGSVESCVDVVIQARDI